MSPTGMVARAAARTILLLLLLGAAPGRAQRHRLSFPTPAQRLRQRPIERPLPGPHQVVVGRFLSERYTARGPRASGTPGDYFVRSATLLGVLRASDGALVDLAAAPGFVDGVGWAKVAICCGQAAHALELAGFTLIGPPRPSIEVRGRAPALGIEVRTRYHIPPAGHRLEMQSELHNVSGRRLDDVALCDDLGLGNTRVQVAGVGEVRRTQRPQALFAARREAGVTYLLMRPDGKDLQLRLEMSRPALAFDPGLDVAYDRGPLLPDERRWSRRALVVRRGTAAEALAEGLAASAVPTLQAQVQLDEEPVREGASVTQLQVRRDGRPFLLTEAARSVRLVLPRSGRYSVAVLVPGAGEGQSSPMSPRQTFHPQFPPRATLLVGVVDGASQPLPSRLLIRGDEGTAEPAFGSEGLRVENLVYLPAARQKVVLAPGVYRVLASRGPHYSVAESRVELGEGETRALTLKLRRVVTARGWLSADLHLHTSSSFDSPVTPSDRVVAGAAQGMDLLVLTDHNVVTRAPEAPTSRAVEATGEGLRMRPAPAHSMLVVSGQEVTSYGHLVGHFNVFPLPPGPPISARDTTPARVFAEARRRGPESLIQVNHPRMGSIGYFDLMALDPTSGRARAAYDGGFDLLEVLNGDDLDQPEAVDRVLRDWYQLLNRGLRYIATAGSDGHRLGVQETGTPRTLILWDETEKGGQPTEAAALAALRAGRAVASSGPFVRFTIDGKPVGSQLRGGRTLPLRLQVEAPAWMSVSTATLIANGVPLQSFRARPGEALRLEVRQRLRPKVDTWYVVVVRGQKEDPMLLRRGIVPFAVTNPIFVDVDGDGRCLPKAASMPLPASHPAARER